MARKADRPCLIQGPVRSQVALVRQWQMTMMSNHSCVTGKYSTLRQPVQAGLYTGPTARSTVFAMRCNLFSVWQFTAFATGWPIA